MSPKVYQKFEEIVDEFFDGKTPGSVVELGAYRWSLLAINKFADSRRVAVNLSFSGADRDKLKSYEMVETNINNLPFRDEEFDCVLSCSVFEHDKYFWKSLSEVSRVIKRGGLFVVGLPVYTSLKTDYFNTTLTYNVHGKSYNADFYRFSEQSMREVIFEGFNVVKTVYVRKYPNPYIVMAGIKK